MRRRIRKFADRQADREQTNREQFKNWGHSNPLWIVGRAGQLYWNLLQYNTLKFKKLENLQTSKEQRTKNKEFKH